MIIMNTEGGYLQNEYVCGETKFIVGEKKNSYLFKFNW